MSDKDLDVPDVDTITQEVNTIDLSGYGAAESTFSIDSGYGADTITIDSSTMNSMYTSTITLPTSTINNLNGGYYISNGASGAAGSVYTTNGSNGYSWNTTTTPTVNITGTGIDMAAGTDIKIDGKSLKEFMTKLEERLSILVPDPAKLEKFAALKKAYEHYKLMESLCQEIPKEED
jgi:hypothetical protein